MKLTHVSRATGAACVVLFTSAFTLAAGHGAPASPTVRPQAMPASPAITPHSVQHATGQPNQSCGSPTAPSTPGQAAAAPGSAFNPDGKAGTVYAGQQPQNSRNPVSVSQYDAACSHQP